jgi:hypothetical protein
MDFWEMSDNQIKRLMDRRIYDTLFDSQETRRSARLDRIDTLSDMLMECGWDRTLMRLKYADEIAELELLSNYPWFSPGGRKQGQLNAIAVGTGVGKSMVVDIEGE